MLAGLTMRHEERKIRLRVPTRTLSDTGMKKSILCEAQRVLPLWLLVFPLHSSLRFEQLECLSDIVRFLLAVSDLRPEIGRARLQDDRKLASPDCLRGLQGM